MMRETPIAFGLTLVICLALLFYCWYIQKLRNRLVSIQVSATPDVVHEKTGIQKEVVNSYPTVKTHELKVNIRDELQCPICLVEYGDAETLRKLPHCGHVFHIHCVDSWLAHQVTCPVCRIALTGAPNLPPAAWILANRPLPLPPAIPTPGSSGSRTCDVEVQLLKTKLGLPREPPPAGFSFRSRSADIAITECKDCISHSTISERWMTESFSFGIASGDDAAERAEALDVAEMYRGSRKHSHLPLTVSPEHCSFEFLPIVAGPGGDRALRS